MQFRDNQAIYIQIAEYLCEQMLLKKWKQDERIISIRELSEQIEISPNTVQRAFDFLQQKEIITNKRGIGYFMDEDTHDRIMAFRQEQFMQNELPVFLRSLYLLKIDMKKLKEHYDKFVKENFPK
jgi:GntR family transcriptional regulator